MILLIIKWICFSYIFINFRPIQDILENLRDDYHKLKGLEKFVIYLISIFKKVTTCIFCFAFWSFLIYSQGDILSSCVVSTGAILLEKIINWFPDRLF